MNSAIEMHEHWKDVVGYEGLYQVSTLGRVRSKDRVLLRRHNRTASLVLFKYKGQPLKIWINSGTGYPMATLSKGNLQKAFSVHHLVLNAFQGRRPEGYVACHFNGVPVDNRLENLRWGTYKENIEDCRRHGRLALGERVGGAKLKIAEVKKIKAQLQRPYRGINRILGKQYGVTPEAISAIKHNKNWRHL